MCVETKRKMLRGGGGVGRTRTVGDLHPGESERTVGDPNGSRSKRQEELRKVESWGFETQLKEVAERKGFTTPEAKRVWSEGRDVDRGVLGGGVSCAGPSPSEDGRGITNRGRSPDGGAGAYKDSVRSSPGEAIEEERFWSVDPPSPESR